MSVYTSSVCLCIPVMKPSTLAMSWMSLVYLCMLKFEAMVITRTFRNVVRQMMVAVDPVCVRLQKKNRLVRKKYCSKVIIATCKFSLTLHACMVYRAPTLLAYGWHMCNCLYFACSTFFAQKLILNLGGRHLYSRVLGLAKRYH